MRHNTAIAVIFCLFVIAVYGMEAELLRKQFEKVEIDSKKAPSLMECCLKKIGEEEVSEEIIRSCLLSQDKQFQLPTTYAELVISVLNPGALETCKQKIVDALAVINDDKKQDSLVTLFHKLARSTSFIQEQQEELLKLCEHELTSIYVKDAIIQYLPLYVLIKSKLYKDDLLIDNSQSIGGMVPLWAPNGHYFVTEFDDRTAKVWAEGENGSWQCMTTLPDHHIEWIRSMAWSSDGIYIARASDDNTVKIWTKDENDQWHSIATLTGHTRGIRSVAWSPDGIYIVTGSDDKTAKIWAKDENGQWQCIATLNSTNWLNPIVWSSDGIHFVTGSDDNTAVKVWAKDESGQWQCIATLAGHIKRINSVAWSPDGKCLATELVGNTAIKIWAKAENGQWQCIATLTGHTKRINSVAWSPDGECLATGSDDNTAKIWTQGENGQWQCIATLTGHTKPINSIAWSPDGIYLATGSDDNTAKIWTQGENGQWRCIATLNSHTKRIYLIAWSPDGIYLTASFFDWTIKVWDMRLFKKIDKRILSYAEIKQLETMNDEEVKQWIQQIKY